MLNDNGPEQPDKLAAALAKAQAEIKDARKDSENTFTKSRYADLTAVWDAIRKPLTDQGLSVTQTFGSDEGGLFLCTTLWHSSGQSLTSVMSLSFFGVKDAHTLGSACTYARRYSLAALVGCAPEGEDDDGNAVQVHSKKRKPPAKRKAPATVEPIVPSTREKAEAIVAEVSGAPEYLTGKGVDIANLPPGVADRIVGLGADGLKESIQKAAKKAAEATAKKIIEEADKVEPIKEEAA